MSLPAARCRSTTDSLSVRYQVAGALSASAGSSIVAQALGDEHVVGVDHAGHAVAHRLQVADLGVDERPGVELGARRRSACRG